MVTKIVEGGTTCELTSLVPTPKDGATYAFEVRANGPTNDAQYVTSGWSTKSAESAAWKTPVVEYGLTVGGVDVTSANAADVLNDGTVSYDPSSQTLTLKNASITGTNEGNCSIEVDPGMTLALTIALEGSNSCGPIMTQKGATTITGSGSLTVTQPNGGEGQTGISAQDEISIDGAKLIVNSKESGITTNGGDVTIQNGAQVEISCTDKEAYCAIISKDLTVTGAVTQATDESYSYADDKSAYLRFEPSGTAYRLTVEDGPGAGSYVAGTSVSVVASAPVSDKHFAGWTVDPEGMGVMENANASSTTFTMPACDVTLTATFENHTLTHYEAVPSTCTDDGTIEYWECEECGLLFSDNAGTNQIAEADLVDPADGHNYVNGVCIVCGARQPGQVTPPSDPTYPPEVEEGEGGTVEVTPERPHEGDKVTIAPDPDDGQVVDEIVVIGDDGEPIDVVDNGDGTWSFEQPGGKVTITVTFRCDGGELCPTRGFLDVDQSQWYHAAADWAVTEGVLNGYGDGGELLGPLNTITRAEMAQVLWNRAGRPEATADLSQFSDVDPDAWYADAVAWCLSEGIFRGYGDTFGTERPISREEVATVLWRLSGSPEPSTDLSSFSDSGYVSGYATDALSWAVESGVVTGKDDGAKLDPQGVCTRAEAAAMLMRMGE